MLNSKKMLSFLLAICLIVALCAIPVSAAFSDVPSGKWYSESVDYASKAGYVTGYEDGTFRPDQTVTRAEFAAIMNQVLDLRTPAWVSYDDVPLTSWYASAVRNCVKAGIIAGYDSKHFGPNDPVTRQQAAVILARAYDLEKFGGRSKFSDDEKIAEYAVGYVKSMVTAGLMAGMGYNQFQPTGNMTRAQMVTILHAIEQTKSAYQKLADGEDIRILAVGDSIGEGVGASNTGLGFVNLVKEKLDSQYHVSCTVRNLCVSGTSSYYGYAMTKLLDDQVCYDLVIVCYGHNDSEIGFSKNYELLLHTIKLRYPHSSIIAVAEHTQRDTNNDPSLKMRMIESLCDHYNADIADVAKAFNANRGSSLISSDGLHPNNAGHAVYSDTIKSVVDQNVASRKNWAKTPDPADSSVKDFDHITYFNKDRFQKVNDTTYEMTVPSEQSGYVGVYCTITPGAKSVTVAMDNNKLTWNPPRTYTYSQDDVIQMGNGTAKSKIVVTFGTTAQAETFNGVLISY